MPAIKPFPFPSLHVGHDIVHIARIHSLVTKQNGKYLQPFLRRIFTPHERKLLQARFGDLSGTLQDKDSRHHLSAKSGAIRNGGDIYTSITAHLAGRFAAKEAVMKAHPGRELSWHDISVLPSSPVSTQHASSAGTSQMPGSGEQTTRSHAPVVLVTLPVANPATGSEDGATNADPTAPGTSKSAGVERHVVQLSISHDGEYASAVALAWDDAPIPLPEAVFSEILQEEDEGLG